MQGVSKQSAGYINSNGLNGLEQVNLAIPSDGKLVWLIARKVP
jgi:hypothetical protein